MYNFIGLVVFNYLIFYIEKHKTNKVDFVFQKIIIQYLEPNIINY